MAWKVFVGVAASVMTPIHSGVVWHGVKMSHWLPAVAALVLLMYLTFWDLCCSRYLVLV